MILLFQAFKSPSLRKDGMLVSTPSLHIMGISYYSKKIIQSHKLIQVELSFALLFSPSLQSHKLQQVLLIIPHQKDKLFGNQVTSQGFLPDTHRNSNIIARSIFKHKEQWQIMLFCWEMLNGWIPYRISWSKSFLTKIKGLSGILSISAFPKQATSLSILLL